MAHFTRLIEAHGPLVRAVFHISNPRFKAMRSRGIPTPQPVVGMALLDTGASCSCIDPSVTASLQLQRRGYADVLTPSTGQEHHQTDEYDVSIIIPPGRQKDQPLILQAQRVVHAELLERQHLHALIGRDVLQRCLLNYNGTAGYFTLAW